MASWLLVFFLFYFKKCTQITAALFDFWCLFSLLEKFTSTTAQVDCHAYCIKLYYSFVMVLFTLPRFCFCYFLFDASQYHITGWLLGLPLRLTFCFVVFFFNAAQTTHNVKTLLVEFWCFYFSSVRKSPHAKSKNHTWQVWPTSWNWLIVCVSIFHARKAPYLFFVIFFFILHQTIRSWCH